MRVGKEIKTFFATDGTVSELLARLGAAHWHVFHKFIDKKGLIKLNATRDVNLEKR